ncbi:hypothetical protein SASPL_152288 [Salvia splendens]|uniref:Uncharacterized protein n=1 Tax=Salvia splendens TaxID=180675 RepID=A0A8X8W2R1_SALSN|nr:uncharacterized protein LOC121785241 [Salvia splendens]KAG6387105.1 hypothetical protein SASPL_152288 [Salvia splendens]
MPSGAKKRKAAKKKQGAQPNSNNPNPSLAASTQDVKHEDDRQSDVGEASSTTSNPSHHDLLTEGEEEKVQNRENAPPVEGVKIEGNNAVPIEREFKTGEEFPEKFEHEETERKSYDGGSSGSSRCSSRSSSDDESHGVKRSHAVIDTVPAISIGEASEAVVDCVPPVVSDKVLLLSESMKVNTSSPSGSKESGEKKGSVEEQVGGSETFYDAEATTPFAEYVGVASDLKTSVEETRERLSLSYNAPIATHDNGADLEKDSGVTESLLVPPPRPVQTTSWKGCCGLFELFTGSDR